MVYFLIILMVPFLGMSFNKILTLSGWKGEKCMSLKKEIFADVWRIYGHGSWFKVISAFIRYQLDVV